MSTQTTHLKLDLRESSDIFNPLSTNANFESLDNIIYEIQKKGGVPTFTTTASANLLKLSENPTPNSTVFKFVAAGDANTWSFAETINDIVALDGSKKTVNGGDMYVAWVNSANAMVVIAWPDVVNAQTFDGKGPSEWATAAQLQAVNQSAANATQTAQAAATVANNALEVANEAGFKPELIFQGDENVDQNANGYIYNLTKPLSDFKFLIFVYNPYFQNNNNEHDRVCEWSIAPQNNTTRISIGTYADIPITAGGTSSQNVGRHLRWNNNNSLISTGRYLSSGSVIGYSFMQIIEIYGVK